MIGPRHLIGAALLAVALPGRADVGLQQTRLAEIVRELEHVRSVVERAREEVPNRPGQRLAFDYDALIDALDGLERATRGHIDLQNTQPRNHFVLGDTTSSDTGTR